jgi:hypothetical protein
MHCFCIILPAVSSILRHLCPSTHSSLSSTSTWRGIAAERISGKKKGEGSWVRLARVILFTDAHGCSSCFHSRAHGSSCFHSNSRGSNCMSCSSRDCTDSCMGCSNPDSNIRSLGYSILFDSYCTDYTECCSGYCIQDNCSCNLDCSILFDSYCTDCCSSDSNYSLVYKGRIVQRQGCYLLRLPQRRERQLTLVLWHHVSSKFHISPLRHYVL